jgi:cell filamentation protein, protein adenylyltransferase
MNPFTPHKLPIKNIDWEHFIPLIAEANRELARYDGLLQSIPNTEIILSPLTTQEAVLSSKIEGTQATLEDVLEFEAKKNKNIPKYDDIEEVINYRRTLDEASERIRNDFPISLRFIRDMHRTLLQGVRGESSDRGNFRRIQNWIGKPGSTVETARFVPPPPNNLIEHLDNLEKYIHYDEKDRIIQLAFIHAQFEIIHPFLDGNGRIGRLLIPLFLFEKKLLSKPLFYISAYFESDRETYYENLLAITKNSNWNNWIEYFLTAVKEQAKKNIILAKEILMLYDKLKQEIMDSTASKYSIKILDFLFEKPIFTTKDFIQALDIKRQIAARYLNKLENDNIIMLVEKGSGNKASVFRFERLLEITNLPKLK